MADGLTVRSASQQRLIISRKDEGTSAGLLLVRWAKIGAGLHAEMVMGIRLRVMVKGEKGLAKLR